MASLEARGTCSTGSVQPLGDTVGNRIIKANSAALLEAEAPNEEAGSGWELSIPTRVRGGQK